MENEYFAYIQRISKYKDILKEIEEVINAKIEADDDWKRAVCENAEKELREGKMPFHWKKVLF